ncbi:MAG TPA: ATP-binding protein [Candidatus Saccharimonadales bacterium]|nr:ATP-binding protein [Candidatus Saccharimonadales bacterium]
MQSLWFKVFLRFWLAMSIVIAALVLVIGTTQSRIAGTPYAAGESLVVPLLGGTVWARMALAAVALALAALVCLWLARGITAPIARLREATRSLAQGNLGIRVGSPSGHRRDILADLGHDFDRMAEQIEKLMSSQRRLLIGVSHELRSPLARLSVALGIAWRHTDPAMEKSLESIEREADRLDELIGILLGLARLESGVEVANREPIELDALIREVTVKANFEGQGRRVTVRILKSEPCSLAGIRSSLQNAVENVLRNAVKSTAEGTDVEVTLRRVRESAWESAVIQVEDHGEGVPEQCLDGVFDPFSRVAKARGRASSGVGLGLTMAQRIVQLHGGEVKARNSSSGGLLVELSLPLGDRDADNP